MLGYMLNAKKTNYEFEYTLLVVQVESQDFNFSLLSLHASIVECWTNAPLLDFDAIRLAIATYMKKANSIQELVHHEQKINDSWNTSDEKYSESNLNC